MSWLVTLLTLLLIGEANAQPVSTGPRLLLENSGTPLGRINVLDCQAGITCSRSGLTGTITTGGSTQTVSCANATTDSATIQTALDAVDAAGGGIVQIGCGTCLLQATLLVGDNTILEGAGFCTVLKRDTTLSSDPSFYGTPPSCVSTTTCRGYPATSCDNERVAIRNKKKDCGNNSITLRDFAIDGSLIGALACGSTCVAGPDAVSVTIIMSAVRDLLIDHLYIHDVPQDAILIKNAGDRTVVSHTVIDGFNMHWGNGGGVNMEMHTTALIPGTSNIHDNYIIARAPDFCANDMSTSCDQDSTCTTCSGGSCSAGVCSGGVRNGKPCTGTCGSAAVVGIAPTTIDTGSQQTRTIIANNRLELTDKHYGINGTGSDGMLITGNRMMPYDSGTLETKMYSGIQLNAVPSTSKPLRHVTISDNIILGGLVAGDRRAVLIDGGADENALCVAAGNPISCCTGSGAGDCNSRELHFTGNIITDKDPASATPTAVTIRGFDDMIVANNSVRNVKNGHGIEIGASGTHAVDAVISGNEVSDVVTATYSCYRILAATRARILNNVAKDCTRGIQLGNATSGTFIGSNTYSGTTSELQQLTTDATLRWVDPSLGLTLSQLPTSISQGSQLYCTNCQAGESPCTSTGGLGAAATYINTEWDCNGGGPASADPLDAIDPTSRAIFGSSDKSNATDKAGFWLLGGYTKNQLYGINKLSNVTVNSLGTITLTNPALAFSGTEDGSQSSFTISDAVNDTVIVEATTSSGALPTNIFSSGLSWFATAQFRNNGSYIARPLTVKVEARYTNSDGAACNTVACPYVTVFPSTGVAQPFFEVGLTFSPSMGSPYNIFAIKWTFTSWSTTGQNFLISLGLHHRSEQAFPGYVRRDGNSGYPMLGPLAWSANLGSSINHVVGPSDEDLKIVSGSGKRALVNGGDAVTVVDYHALTGQTADIADTNFANSSTAGVYRVSYEIWDATADAAAGAVTLNIKWNDGTAARTVSSAAVLLTATSSFTQGIVVARLGSGNITYGTTHTGLYGTAAYAAYFTLEKLRV